MAECLRYVCSACGRAIEAWSDGNPYYVGTNGLKKYAYHPDPEVNRCVGNDSPHLCLACGDEFNVDSRAPIEQCPKCGATTIVSTFRLSGRPCPYCSQGKFFVDPEFRCIS